MFYTNFSILPYLEKKAYFAKLNAFKKDILVYQPFGHGQFLFSKMWGVGNCTLKWSSIYW